MITLAEHGQSAYRIVMPHPSHETVKLACDEFHYFFYRITGASLPVTTELQPADSPQIFIGDSARLRGMGIALPEGLGEEGYIIRTVGEHLVIAGRTPRGTLYAVYAFLEEQLDCRWYASDAEYVPCRLSLVLPPLNLRDVPAFESREVYWRDAYDGKFSVRNRLNGNKHDISIRQGGRQKWYNFHHSFDDLVPTRVYFEEHPEYYSLVNGVRLPRNNQLCLTNPDVLRIAEETLRHWIRENPDCTVFSISQNDWDNHCQCECCMSVEQAEESASGPVIWFVNQLAEAIAEDHPGVLLHTFAYLYTRKAPLHIRPYPNVIVRLCDIECCFSHPLDGTLPEGVVLCPEDMQHKDTHINGPQCAQKGEVPFLRDLIAWSAICRRLYIWDYVTDFHNYLMPFPNLSVLQKNLQLFRRYGVSGVLEQGAFPHGGGAHFAELQAYIQAKLLWNPDADLWGHVEDFLRGYYGEAAEPLLRQYIDLWQQAAAPWHFSIYMHANAPFVTDELLLASERLLCEALYMTRTEELRARIERLRLGITYMLISRMPIETPGRDVIIERFGWECRAHGIAEIHERWPLTTALTALQGAMNGPTQSRPLISDYKM
ncbi:MAG: DUF4838 domain-containing protein [Clostridia bacterium]|nr:DUF4838 domain-containing protein [Clostridia bacterium]